MLSVYSKNVVATQKRYTLYEITVEVYETNVSSTLRMIATFRIDLHGVMPTNAKPLRVVWNRFIGYALNLGNWNLNWNLKHFTKTLQWNVQLNDFTTALLSIQVDSVFNFSNLDSIEYNT